MQSALPLNPRHRVGLVIAVVALAIGLNPLNRQFAVWLRHDVVQGVPFWLDHLLFMMTLMVVVWGLIGLLLLGLKGMALRRPERSKEAWLTGLLSGFGLSALALAVIASFGPVSFEPNPNWPVLFANFASNFYEELVFRGVVLGLLVKILDGKHTWVAAVLSAALFCQGHLHYPAAFLAVVFVAGLVWAWMTIRYQSLWPAWLSHTLADVIVDNLFKT